MINPFGHIGNKCRQAVNVLAESIVSTAAVGDQPSRAHVVQEGEMGFLLLLHLLNKFKPIHSFSETHLRLLLIF